ncbi:ADOP family duplicated permease [Aliikangiella maris]|uniref:ADOP family duplicated permease n=2 Tax=Aliikangiella maris TaxID=3162458 RepID=A0ABV3MPM0_9GAMM
MIFLGDLKYALRLLFKRPGFSILTILVMAAGMGITLYLFSMMNPLVFKALPFKDGDTLVQISGSKKERKARLSINLHDYQEIRTQVKGLTEFSAYTNKNVNVAARDGARRYNAVAAEPNLFKLTRTQPVLGREFTQSENQQGAERVVVIGYDMWQNQYGGNPNVIDQLLSINGENYRIIGVMPQNYFFPNNADMWLPLREDTRQTARENATSIYGLAHLNSEKSLAEVNQQLKVIMQRLEQRYPKTNTDLGAYSASLPMTVVGDGIVIVYSMHIIAILILFLASINVGNLLLSRAVERGKETAIRVALGAPRSRLISQMLWESIIICTFGGILGLLAAAWGLEVTDKILATFWFDKPNFWWKLGIDGYSMKIFFLFVISTILLTGLLPAWKNSGGNFNAVLRDGTRGALSKKSGRLNRILVISEIFISMTVLIAAGVIMVATYLETHAEYGAKIDNTLTGRILLTESRYDTPEKQIQFIQALQSNLERENSIGNIMISSALPGMRSESQNIAIEGKEYDQANNRFPEANTIVITPGSLESLGVALKSGRYFNSSDNVLDKRTIIVTDSFVKTHFNNQDAIGKRIRVVDEETNQINWLTIVGVVAHTSQGLPNEHAGKRPSIFRPYAQSPRSQVTVAIQMKSSVVATTQTLRQVLQSIDPELPAFRIETYASYIERNSAATQLMSSIFLIFGIAAAILAASGIYGVMSNTITQRTQEIGVKRALGAWEEKIVQEFLMKGFKQLLWGSIPGLLAGCAMGFVMSKALGTGSMALIIIAIIILMLIACAVLLATYIPTKNALKMEPSDALHYE